MNNLTVTVKFRNIYGRTLAYPDDFTAQMFAELAGHITLTAHDLAMIEQLGYTINDSRGGRADWKAEGVE